jgi:iron(III) transport system ATP-binding protein
VAEVKITSVTKRFGDVIAVNNFNAVIKHGEFVSILGPSGCGKTTMLRMVAGFENASAGEVMIGDKLVSSTTSKVFVPPEKRGIGMVFQSYAVWPHMTVFDNVAYPLKIKKFTKPQIAEKTNRALELVHLAEYAKRLPNQLSGGQQQRVALARALVMEPSLLLLDEPLSNLDAKLRESMRFEIKELQKALDITVIYVTHDQAEAMAMSDRIIVMNQGVIQQVDVPRKIYEQPANKIVADFIGLVNFIEGDAQAEFVKMPKLQYALNYRSNFRGPAVIGVRPEQISMSHDGGGLVGTLASKFYMGESIDWRVDVNGQLLRVIDKAGVHLDYNVGDKVSLSFDKIMVFPQPPDFTDNQPLTTC